MSRPGDWNCRSCHHLNFQRRDTCQRCGESRFGGYGAARVYSTFEFTTGSDVRPGDWYCSVGNCGTHNFASRSTCFNCGTFKDEPVRGFDLDVSRSRGLGGNRSGWKSGDWICTRLGCNGHNFASRIECFRYSAPRDFINRISY